MIDPKKLFHKVIFISVLLIISGILPKKALPQNSQSVRVAIVYNDSETGKRYRDGILNVLTESVTEKRNIEILDVPYIKPSHGEDTIKKLIRNNLVDVILGPTESDVYTKVYNTDGIADNKISVISGLATTDVGNSTRGYFFRLNLEATERVFEVWSYLNRFLISKIAVIYENTEFGRTAETTFRELLKDSDLIQNYTSVSYISPQSPMTEIQKLIKERPEVIGLFCEREDVSRIYEHIQKLNNSGVPYHPYFFTIIDVTSVGEGLKNIYFPSLTNYTDTVLQSNVRDEVYLLGQVSANLLLNALPKYNAGRSLRSLPGRVEFRNQVVRTLRGESKSGINMKFLKMKNLGPAYLYKLNDDRIYHIDSDDEINWLTMVRSKAKLIYSVHNYKMILNLLLMLIITFSVSSIEIRRSFPKKHVKFYLTKVFYSFYFVHLTLVLFLYIFLAHTGRINYSDTIMVIIISITPSAFLKTTFFETKSGQSIGLENMYKRILANIDKQIMNSRYKKLVGLENVIAYSNSEDTMRNALLRLYRNNPSKAQAAKLIQKMEEEITAEKDYMNRKRIAARLIMRQFNRDELKAEGFVPQNWDYEAGIDPVILIRQASKYCAEDFDRTAKVQELLKDELDQLEKRNPERFAEVDSFHKKELSIVMSNEGELLAKLRLLMVLRGFNVDWLLDKGIITKRLLSNSKKSQSNPIVDKLRNRTTNKKESVDNAPEK